MNSLVLLPSSSLENMVRSKGLMRDLNFKVKYPFCSGLVLWPYRYNRFCKRYLYRGLVQLQSQFFNRNSVSYLPCALRKRYSKLQ